MMRILAVDDSTTNNALLEAVLSAKGYQIYTAMDGKEAFSVLDHQEIDLILLDLLMPEIDGFEFLEHIKNNDNFNKIPVIIISAANNQENRNLTKQLGAVDFIEKPIDINLFLDRVDNVLKN